MKKRLLIISSSTLVLALAIPFVADKLINTKALVNNSDLFTNKIDMDVKDNSTVPATLKDHNGKDVTTTFDTGKNGVLLSSSTNDASVELSKNIKGSFETEFRVYSDTHFYDSTGKDYNSATDSVNKYCELKQMTFTFTDATGQSFDISVTGGEKYNTITPAARVVINGNAFGYHYSNDATLPDQTSLKNSGGYYTRIGGTTFTNVARRGGTNTTDSMPITIGFNQETLEVYTYHYGTVSTFTQGVYRVIADLDSDDFGLNKIYDFDNYNVKISFDDIASGKTAKMLVYSINGQTLSGTKIVNNIGPSTLADVTSNAVKNAKYFIPSPKSYDLLEDEDSYKTIVNISNDVGSTFPLYNKDGQVITDGVYQEGAYFIPTVKGNISISYTSYDKENKAGKPAVYNIGCYDSLPTTSFDFEGLEVNYEETNKGVGSTLNIYPAKVNSELFINEKTQDALVSLYKNDSVYKDVKNVKATETMDVVLEEAGNYSLVYSMPGNEAATKTFNFAVSTTSTSVELLSPLQVKYAYGQVLSIPSAKVSLNGEVKSGTPVLYNPEGKVVATSTKDVTLDIIGTYKLSYLSRFSNKQYTNTYYFNVYHTSAGLFTDEKGITTAYGSTQGFFSANIGGTVVTATKNDVSTTYNTVLDLSTNTKNDSLIEIITLPSSIGTLDAWQYKIRLTDVYNAKNYVDITVFKGSWGNQFAYVRAGSSEQTLAGLEMDKVLTAYNTGTPINYSMTGESLLGNEILNLYYDNAEKAVYVDNIKRPGYSYGNLVIDMDDPKYVPENTLWGGFTTGEVYMSLSFQYLQEAQAQFLVKSINGVQFDNLWITDDKAPSITIDTLNYDVNDLPKGQVNVAYPIYDAKVYEAIDGVLDCEVKVYKDYQTINQKEVSTIEDTFIPTETGRYAIVYTAIDAARNNSMKFVYVDVVNKLDDLSYITNKEVETNIYVGTEFVLPKGEVAGGSGNIETVIVLKDPTGKEVDTSSGKVDIVKKGKYVLTITLKDYLKQTKTYTYELNSTYSPNPIISNFVVNDTMIEGYEYDFSGFKAKDYYSNNGIVKDATTKIEVVQNGKTTTLTSTKYTPTATTNGEEVTLRFVATATSGGQSVKEVKAHILKVKNGTSFNLANLFYAENIDTVSAQDKYVEYTTTKNNASLTFANYLVVDGFNIDFTVNKSKNNFSQIDVLLADSFNKDEQILLSIMKGAAGTSTSSLLINNEPGFELSSSFYQVTSYGYKFFYNAKSNSLIDGNTNKSIGSLKKSLSGAAFAGFSSGKMKVSITYKGVTGASSIMVNSVSNQAMTNSTVDRAKPLIQINGDLPLYGEINQNFTVPSAITTDAVDPNAKITLSIKQGSTGIYSGDVSNHYIFAPDKYGIYTIEYVATDSNNRKETYKYIITIKDRIKPQIKLNGEMITEANINQTYTLPQATVTDNNDTDLQLYIFIVAPDDEMRANARNDYSFTPREKGVYTIVYYVQDSYNCYTFQEFEVTVK